MYKLKLIKDLPTLLKFRRVITVEKCQWPHFTSCKKNQKKLITSNVHDFDKYIRTRMNEHKLQNL